MEDLNKVASYKINIYNSNFLTYQIYELKIKFKN